MTKLRPMAVMLLAALAMRCATASAEPLEAEECKALKTQEKALLTATVRAALRGGPDWVKEHLHDLEKIEQVRDYLSVEEKVAFRCRTDGVRIPEPPLPSLPDRKPAVPTFVVAGTDAASLMPHRNPSREAAVGAVVSSIAVAEGEGDIDEGAHAASSDDVAVDSAAAEIEATKDAIARDEAAIRQGLAKP